MNRAGLLLALLVGACGDEGSMPDASPDPEPAVLFRTESEPSGATCPAGGTRILGGVDDDRSGTLDDLEVDDTEVVCAPLAVIEGDVLVRNSVEAERLLGFHVITGTLRIEAPNLTALDLSALMRVDGALIARIDGALEAPQLTTIGGDATFDAPDVTMPRLTTVGGDLSVIAEEYEGPDLAALTSVGGELSVRCEPSGFTASSRPFHFPALSAIGGGITAYGFLTFEAPQVTRVAHITVRAGHVIEQGFNRVRAVRLAELTTVDGAIDFHLANIDAISLPKLRSAASFSLVGHSDTSDGVPTLAVLDLPSLDGAPVTIQKMPRLETVLLGGLTQTPSLSISDHGNLGSLHLPALATAGTLNVAGNRVLPSLLVPMLTTLTTLRVVDNPQLPTCQAEAIATRTGAESTISGNGPGPCP